MRLMRRAVRSLRCRSLLVVVESFKMPACSASLVLWRSFYPVAEFDNAFKISLRLNRMSGINHLCIFELAALTKELIILLFRGFLNERA